jgi:hypothetical protein
MTRQVLDHRQHPGFDHAVQLRSAERADGVGVRSQRPVAEHVVVAARDGNVEHRHAVDIDAERGARSSPMSLAPNRAASTPANGSRA